MKSHLFKQVTKRLPVFIAIVSLNLLAVTYCNGNATTFGAGDRSPLKNSKEIADAVQVQQAYREIYTLYQDRVVFISTEQTVKMPSHPFFNDPFFREFFGNRPVPKERKRQGLGSGFIISEDGYVCTNHHVVANVDSVKVKIDGDSYDAEIIGSDQKTDIALLKIKSRKKFNPVYLGDSDTVQVGDWAIAIGNPFGLDKTFTTGVISAIGRKDLDLMGGYQSFIQTDASINPGNSGGPLINIYGEVIGINRMIYSRSGGYMGIGFAIPINRAKTVLAQLQKHGKIKRGYMGVQIVPFTEEYAEKIGMKTNEGALVGGIVGGSPAEKGGVKVGDVITHVNGRKIEDFGDLVELVDKTPIGKTLKVRVWRNKQAVNLFITIKERP